MSVTFLNDTVGVPVRDTAGASSLASDEYTLSETCAGGGSLPLGRGDHMDGSGASVSGTGAAWGSTDARKAPVSSHAHGLCLRSHLGRGGLEQIRALRPLSLSAAKVTGHRSSFSHIQSRTHTQVV